MRLPIGVPGPVRTRISAISFCMFRSSREGSPTLWPRFALQKKRPPFLRASETRLTPVLRGVATLSKNCAGLAHRLRDGARDAGPIGAVAAVLPADRMAAGRETAGGAGGD